MRMTPQETLLAWLDGLARDRVLIAPSDDGGVLRYRPVETAHEIAWEDARPTLSAKEFFFPSTERLLTIEKTGEGVALTETLPAGERVLFGLRPCDARGLLALDALFLDAAPPDPYYARRRADTTLVGLACNQMGSTCFCTSLGGAPDDPTGMDLMLYLTGDACYLQTLTERGRRLLERRPLECAEPAWGLGDHRPAFPGVLNRPLPVPEREAWRSRFDDSIWDEIAERCLGCRICAYVCPTCRCFDIRDEAVPAPNGGQRFERLRCWDSCAGEPYRRIAGGHNARPEKGQRLRNRLLCKFDYFPEQVGLSASACTGCGRCIDACPVNIDLTEIMAYFVEVPA